jgi:hypothetical protein
LIDSIAFRLRYIGYCEKCQCKYEPKPRIAGHDKDECEYNREYTSIVTSIMSGKIALNEDEYIKQANEKLAQGKRSAYQDLCSKKSGIWAFLDLMSIWLTVCLIIFGIVRLTLPPVLEFFKHADFSS